MEAELFFWYSIHVQICSLLVRMRHFYMTHTASS